MYFNSVKKILFSLVCAISLFLNIYFLNNSNAYQQNIIRKVSSSDRKNDRNTTNAFNRISDNNITSSVNRISDNNITYSIKTVEPVTNVTIPLETNNIVIRFVVLPSVSCNNRDVKLVICVPTVRDNFHARNMIRKTWGSYANSSSNEAILLFFIGLGETSEDPLNRRTQQFLDLEIKFYGDIVQGDFVDSYRNLTLKSMSIISWVTTYCPKSQFILKADDDMYVNIPLLVETLKNTASGMSRFIMGEMLKEGRPHRDPISKWFVAYKEYAEETYPHFVLGPSYAMTTSAARSLYHASRYVPMFFLEDVYITGLCAKKAKVPVLHNGMFSNFKQPVSGCFFKKHISAHGYLPEEMVQLHNELFDNLRHC